MQANIFHDSTVGSIRGGVEISGCDCAPPGALGGRRAYRPSRSVSLSSIAPMFPAFSHWPARPQADAPTLTAAIYAARPRDSRSGARVYKRTPEQGRCHSPTAPAKAFLANPRRRATDRARRRGPIVLVDNPLLWKPVSSCPRVDVSDGRSRPGVHRGFLSEASLASITATRPSRRREAGASVGGKMAATGTPSFASTVGVAEARQHHSCDADRRSAARLMPSLAAPARSLTPSPLAPAHRGNSPHGSFSTTLFHGYGDVVPAFSEARNRARCWRRAPWKTARFSPQNRLTSAV